MSVVLIALDGVVLAAHGPGGAGSSGVEAVGHPVWETLSPAHERAERLRLRDDVVRAAKGATVSTQVSLPAGTRGVAATVVVHLTPLRDTAGAVRFVLGSIADVGTAAPSVPALSADLTSRLVHRINNSVNGVKAALAVLRQAVPADAQDVRLLHLVDKELDLLAGVALEVADVGTRHA